MPPLAASMPWPYSCRMTSEYAVLGQPPPDLKKLIDEPSQNALQVELMFVRTGNAGKSAGPRILRAKLRATLAQWNAETWASWSSFEAPKFRSSGLSGVPVFAVSMAGPD